jgi:hypothetical protein
MTTIAKRLYDDHLIYLNEKLKTSHEDMLLEFNVAWSWKDVAQFVLGAAVEYGLDLTVIGIPASFGAETIVDLVFAGSTFGTALVQAFQTKSQFEGESKSIIDRVFDSRNVLSRGFDPFFEHVKTIWSDATSGAGGGPLARATTGVVNSLDRASGGRGGFGTRTPSAVLKQEIKNAIDLVAKNIAEVVSQAIKLVTPEATIGTGVAMAIKQLLLNLSANAYSLLTGAIGRSTLLTQFLTNPTVAKQKFQRAYDMIVSFLRQWAQSLEAGSRQTLSQGLSQQGGVMNTLRSVGTGLLAGGGLGSVGGAVGGVAGAGLGGAAGMMARTPVGQRYMLRYVNQTLTILTRERETFIRIVTTIFDFIIPYLFSILAIYQVVMTGISIDPTSSASRRGLTAAASTGYASQPRRPLYELATTPEGFYKTMNVRSSDITFNSSRLRLLSRI